MRMLKIKWPEDVNNEEVLESIDDARTFLNNILRRKVIYSYSKKKFPSFMLPLKYR